MSELRKAARCACLRVVYSPRKYDDGSLSERWQCESCLREFVPKRAALDAKPASETAIAQALEKVPHADLCNARTRNFVDESGCLHEHYSGPCDCWISRISRALNPEGSDG